MGVLPRMALCLALAGLAYALAPPQEPLRIGLTLFVLIGGLWMTQALHLTVTALLVPLLAALAGVLSPGEALASFAHPVIFLFLGGFALAAALVRHGIDRWLAVAVLHLAGGRRVPSIGLLFGLTALLSMWISNTAAAAMMLPLALGLLRDEAPPDGNHAAGSPQGGHGPREQAFVLLGLAYSASIGGIGTLVGSPPNAIAAAQVGISFAGWLRIGLPLVAVLMPLMVLTLYLLLRPALAGRINTPSLQMEWSRQRVLTLVIFVLTVTGWVAGEPLARAVGLGNEFDTLVALTAIVLLCGTGTLDWQDIERDTRWSVLLLFGGGLALSQVMASTGASGFLANQVVALLHGAPPLVLLLVVVAFVVLLTELVSNTAAAALMVPIFLGVASMLGLPPVALAAAIGVAASCAFMLPVATPPNAIVFSTGQVPQGTMMRCGLALNVVCTVVITAMVYAMY